MNGYPGIPTRNGVPPPNWQRSLDRLQVKDGKVKLQDGAVIPRSSRTVLRYENGSGTLEKIKSIRNGQLPDNGASPDLRKGAGPRNQFSSFGYRRAGVPQQQQQQTQVSPPGTSPSKSSIAKPGSFGFNQKAAGLTKGAKSPPGSDGKSKGIPRPMRGSATSPPDGRVDRKSPQEAKSSVAQRTKIDRSMSADRADGKSKTDHNANTEAWSMGRYQPPAVGSDPNTPVKSKSAMQKSMAQTASIKQMFGSRSKEHVSRDGSPSSDTIISNPHATLKESLMSPPTNRQSLHSTTSLHMHHTVPSVNRRASSGLSVDLSFSKTPFSDSLRYSGYMSDSYTSVNRDSGLGSLHSGMGGYKSGTLSTDGQGSLRRSESGSLESLDSNNSSSMSITSRATSERYGLTSPPTTGLPSVQRSNSLRSTLSDKPMSYAVTSKDMDETSWMQNKYAEGAGPLSPTGSSSSQTPQQFFAMAAALGQMTG